MNEVLKITGGIALEGRICAAGAKNSITKLLIASLLSDKKCLFLSVPDIGDLEITLELCQEIGMQIEWNKEEKTLLVQTPHLKTCYVPQRFSGSNRIPILMMGALLGRTKEEVIIPTVGGCNLGKRPVNFHVEALKQLGASIEYREMKNEGAYFAHAHDGLKSAIINLDYPSVGATENALLASVRARGKTVIKNAAIEPEVLDLVLFLQKLGANINIESDRTFVVEGVDSFFDVEHTVISDRIEAASYAMAAVASNGRVFIEGAEQMHMMSFLNKLRSVGGGFKVYNDGIEFFQERPLAGSIQIETDVYPGFSTDWQQPFIVLLTQVEGASVIHETVYENRYGFVKTLKEMGAKIHLHEECLGKKKCRFAEKNYEHSAIVHGPTELKASRIVIPDLRAGFAYVMAALLCSDESTIEGLPFIDRGYETLYEKLQALGANVQRCKIEETKPQELVLN
jgi:UDP-N-acetylglucosamine 1-carboxyvinyltransferase